MLLNYITFKAPQILLLFPILVGILIYIYIKFYSNKKIIFPSFFLLENYTNNNKSGIKIRLPFRFFYELLILFIFSILLAGITIVKSKKTFLIFIDNSFSTKAKTSRYVTNIDNIKNDAILAIENLNTKGNFKIITSSLDVNTDPLDKNKAINTIKQIESTYSEDNLSTYNFNIADYEQIFIFTDKALNTSSDKIKIYSNELNKNICNFSISNLNILDDLIYVTISSYCYEKRNIYLSLSCNNKQLLKNKLEINRNEQLIENLKIPSDIINDNKTNLCKVEISSKGDHLLEDNEAFLVYNKKLTNVYLINNENNKDHHFFKLPFNIISINKGDLNKIKNEDIVIFNNVTLDSLPSHNSIIMNPTKGSLFFSDFIKDSSLITYFDKSSPILSYINPLVISKNNFISLKNENDFYLESLLKIKESIILGTFNHNNLKYIISGFSYLPYKNISTSEKILFLNSIKYLNNRYISNYYKLLPYSYINNENNKLTNIKTTGFFKIDNVHEAFNYFNSKESDITKIENTNILISNKKTNTINTKINNIIFYYLKILLFILIILEFTYFLMKNIRNKRY